MPKLLESPTVSNLNDLDKSILLVRDEVKDLSADMKDLKEVMKTRKYVRKAKPTKEEEEQSKVIITEKEKVIEVEKEQSEVIESSVEPLENLGKKTKELGQGISSTVTKFSDSENVFAKGLKGAVSIFAPQLALLPDAFEGIKDAFGSLKDLGGDIKKSFSEVLNAPKQVMKGFGKAKEFLGFGGKKKEKDPDKKQQTFLSKVYEKILKTDKRELKLSRDEKKINLKDLKISKKALKIDEKELKISKQDLKLEKKQTKAIKEIEENTEKSMMDTMFGENRGIMDLLGLGGLIPGGRKGGKGSRGISGQKGAKGGIVSKLFKSGPGKLLGAGAGLLGGAASIFGLPSFGGDKEELGAAIPTDIPTKPKVSPEIKKSKGLFDKLKEKITGKAAKKAGAKGIGKSLLKKIPGIGAIAGLGFGASRLMGGDPLGALGEMASGFASIIPGIGTAASTAIDAALIAKDVSKDDEEQKSDVEKTSTDPLKKGKLPSEFSKSEKKLKEVGKLPPELRSTPVSKTKVDSFETKSFGEGKLSPELKAAIPGAITTGIIESLAAAKPITNEIEKETEKKKITDFSKIFGEEADIEKVVVLQKPKETPMLTQARTNVLKESEQTTSIPTSLERIKTMTSTTPAKLDIKTPREPEHAANVERSFGKFNNQPDDYRLVFITTGGQ